MYSEKAAAEWIISYDNSTRTLGRIRGCKKLVYACRIARPGNTEGSEVMFFSDG